MKLLRMAFAPLAAMALLMKDVSTELHLAAGPTDPVADLDLIYPDGWAPTKRVGTEFSLLGWMTASLTDLTRRATDALAASIDTALMPNRGRLALVT
jgi:hypothetical protein